MSKLPNDFNILVREQEHDEANAVRWLMETPDEGKTLVWEAIQKEPKSKLEDVVLRFAQLGMTHAMLLALKQ